MHCIKDSRVISKLLLLIITFMLWIFMSNNIYAKDEVYEDGIYRYIITNEDGKEVQLIGIDYIQEMKELLIPSKVTINNVEYQVTKFNPYYSYFTDEYRRFYQSVTKMSIEESFSGTIENISGFVNLKEMEFHGNIVAKKVDLTVGNRKNNFDFLFIVPKGKEQAYKNVIHYEMNYYNYSDLYEHDIQLTPTIVSSNTEAVEYGTFQKDGFIYQVTKSGLTGIGNVQLVGLTGMLKQSYIKLPELVKNGGYTYTLTKLYKYSMIGSGAKVVIIPDTVNELDSSIFDKNLEYLFISKNLKIIPKNIITDENNESNLMFVYVPEGITEIEANAFNNVMRNKGSIILPKSIKSIGKKALYGFQLVTFLNKKPIDQIASTIKNGTTVKVPEASLSSYKKLFTSKVTVVAAKNIVKSTTLSINKKSVNTKTSVTTNLIGTLSKTSNETVYWTSSDSSIFEISAKGVINPKSAGTAYVIAYTRTSGMNQAIKVTVTDKVFTKGIFTYKVTNAVKKTVTITAIKPTDKTSKITIPENVIYNKNTYTVTSVVANDKDTSVALISDKYKNNIIKEIIFPKTITGTVGYLGKMSKIKKITFNGDVPPSSIEGWYLDGGILSKNAIIYVPKGKTKAYQSAVWLGEGYTFTIK